MKTHPNPVHTEKNGAFCTFQERIRSEILKKNLDKTEVVEYYTTILLINIVV
jgi:hypothetical protein